MSSLHHHVKAEKDDPLDFFFSLTLFAYETFSIFAHSLNEFTASSCRKG